jgi:hypothetical protein
VGKILYGNGEIDLYVKNIGPGLLKFKKIVPGLQVNKGYLTNF